MASVVGKTTAVLPADLHTFHQNPRQGDIPAIAASLRRHGQYKPVTGNVGTHTDRPNEILAGNHTLMAFRDNAEAYPDDARWCKIQVFWVDVDDDTCNRIVAADNQTGQLGGFDAEKLLALIETFNGDLDGTGYVDADIEALTALHADALAVDFGSDGPAEPPPPKPEPQPRYDGDQFVLHHGDSLEVLKTLAADSIDAVVTDPPYGLEFMGKDWDAPWKGSASSFADARTRRADELDDPSKGKYIRAGVNAYEAGLPFQNWCQQWATECLRILRPGGHMLAFGGTRTWHRLATAIEDAGFEVRDSMAWLYGSGFPKSLDVSKAIDKAAGAAREVVGQAKRTGKKTGTYGAFAGDNMLTAPATDAAKQWEGWGTALKPSHEPIVVARKPLAEGTVAANVLAHGTGALNIDACRIGTGGGGNACAGGEACHCADKNEIFGATKHPVRREGDFGRWPANVILDDHTAAEVDRQSGVSTSRRAELTSTPGDIYGGGAGLPSHTGVCGHDDEGGASRFFYTAKASTSERPKDDDGTAHPTVKPLELMRWLVRLVTPPKGVVLEPFAGSGTTVEACLIEGFACVAIEREADYIPLIVQRIRRAGGVIADPDDDMPADPYGFTD